MIMSKALVNPNSTSSNLDKFGSELRRGPWTLEEDNLLIQYISCHGEGQWNSLAKDAGLKRTGKSCRLRWLNYLKPDIKRGNLSPQEQLLILELHSKLGNRWSKIAKHLPGRTDNEIKNYWRTRVQKQARQLQVDSNSRKFLEAVQMFWKPRLLEKIEQDSSTSSSPSSATSTSTMDLAPMPLPCPKSSNGANNSDSSSSGNMTVRQLPEGLEKLTTGEIQWECPLEDTHYYVGIPSYDTQELDAQGISLFECHVGGTDWLGEDLENGFWNSDELWQFRKPEAVGTGF